MAQRVDFTLIVVCQSCNQKNRAIHRLLRKTNCGKCHVPLLQPDRPQGVVYLLKSGHYYKIGKADDLKKRLRGIKLQLPFETETIHSIEAFFPFKAEKIGISVLPINVETANGLN